MQRDKKTQNKQMQKRNTRSRTKELDMERLLSVFGRGDLTSGILPGMYYIHVSVAAAPFRQWNFSMQRIVGQNGKQRKEVLGLIFLLLLGMKRSL